MLRPANGVTVTLDSPVEAGLYEIFDLSLGGNVALSPGAVERVVPEWWGTGDDSTDDTDIDATDHAVAAIPNGTIAFAPGRSYTLCRTLRGAPGFRWEFNDTTFVAESSGSYDDVLDNSAVDTGFDVFFATDGGHQSIHHGRLWLDGERVPNLCGISGNTANNHSVQRSEFVVFRDFERGNYALDQSNGNTLVGHSFGTVDFRRCGTDIYLDSAGSDDLVFDVVRSHGSTLPAHAGRANITLRFACGVVMHSLFIRGQGPDRAGLSLTNRSSLVCDHLYLEGDFDTPLRVAGNRNHLWAGDIKVSISPFTSANGQVVDVGANADSCLLDMTFNDRVAASPNVTDIVRINADDSSTYGRTIIVRMAFPTTARNPILYAGPGPSDADHVAVYAEGGKYIATSTTAVQPPNCWSRWCTAEPRWFRRQHSGTSCVECRSSTRAGIRWVG